MVKDEETFFNVCGSQDLEQDLSKLQEDLEKVSKQRGEFPEKELTAVFLIFIILSSLYLEFYSHAGWSNRRLHPVHQPADRREGTLLSCVSADIPLRVRAAGSHRRHAVQTAAGAGQAEKHRAGLKEEGEEER